MNILEALSTQKKTQLIGDDRTYFTDGQLTISNSVFYSALYRGGYDVDFIYKAMHRPIEDRDFILEELGL